MCLLLGPPGSGKSSLLKILAGKIQGSNLVQVSAVCTSTGHCCVYIYLYLQECVLIHLSSWYSAVATQPHTLAVPACTQESTYLPIQMAVAIV